MVQSRLSHFFKKPINDAVYDKEVNSKQENQTDELCFEINSPSATDNIISSS